MTNLGAQEKSQQSLSHIFDLILIPEGGSWLFQSPLSDSKITKCLQLPRILKLCANNHLVPEEPVLITIHPERAHESHDFKATVHHSLSVTLHCKWTAAQMWGDWRLILERSVKPHSGRAQLETHWHQGKPGATTLLFPTESSPYGHTARAASSVSPQTEPSCSSQPGSPAIWTRHLP